MRNSRAQKPWNVPTQTLEFGTRASIRWRISPAALFVKVMARTLSGAIPECSRWATRRVMTRVLPDPAPARTKRGPWTCVTASRWAGVKSSSKSIEIDTSCTAAFPNTNQVAKTGNGFEECLDVCRSSQYSGEKCRSRGNFDLLSSDDQNLAGV